MLSPAASLVTCTLSIHDQASSPAHVLFNAAAVPHATFAPGSLLLLRAPAGNANDDGGRPLNDVAAFDNASSLRGQHGRRLRPLQDDDPLVFLLRDIGPETKAKLPRIQLSVSQHVAELYHLTKNSTVQILSADEALHTATHVEISFKDVYLNRADMHRMTSSVLLQNALVSGELIHHLGSVRVTVGGIYINGRRRRSAYFAPSTKPVFRSESARFILYIQMSREMWDFDSDGAGEICFSNIVNGLLPQLFRRWSRMHARHLVSIVLFTRIDFDDDAPVGRTSKDPSLMGRACQDFYRVVIGEMSSGEWGAILHQLNREFKTFLNEVLTYRYSTDQANQDPSQLGITTDHDIPSITGRPSPARTGNILEAINIASSPFSKDWIDTDLFRTGLSIVVITPSCGVFDVEEGMLQLTTENLVNNGINIDLICMSRPPLHAVPLFRFQANPHELIIGEQKSGSSVKEPIYAASPERSRATFRDEVETRQFHSGMEQPQRAGSRRWTCVVPQWMHVHFWQTSSPIRNSTQSSKHPSIGERKHPGCSLNDVRMNGVMESEMQDIVMSYLGLSQSIESDESGSSPRKPDEDHVLRRARSRSSVGDRGSLTPNEELSKALGDLNFYDNQLFKLKDAMVKGSELVSQTDDLKIGRLRRESTLTSIFNDVSNEVTPSNSLSRTSPLRRYSSYMRSREQRLQERRQSAEKTDSTKISASVRPSLYRRRSRGNENLMPPLLLANSRGLTPGKAAVSTLTQQNSAQYISASASSPISPSLRGADTASVMSISEQIRTSLSRTSTDTSSVTSPTSSQPASIRAVPQDVPKPSRPTTSHTLEFVEPGDPVFDIQSVKKKSPVRVGDDLLRIKGRLSPPLPVQLPLSLAPWLTLVNPARRPRPNQIVDHGWAHAFARPSQSKPLKMKWRSLCSPAALPLTSEYLVSHEILAGLVERPHRITIDEDDSSPSLEKTRAAMLTELISFRLAKGFQIVRSFDASLISPFDLDGLAKDGCSVYLMKGNAIHVLCSAGTDIQITRYQPELNTPEPHTFDTPYSALIRSTLEPSYETVTSSLSLARDRWNWSIIDNYLAGHIENFPEATGYWRARFVLIPIKPGKNARRAFKTPNDDTDDELRIEGIQRLTQIWHRARVREEDGQSVADLTWRREIDPNPLDLEFQTRDASAVLSAGLEDSRLFQGQSYVASTQLFSEENRYRTSKFDLKDLAATLQGENGISVKDRRWYLTMHRYSFAGSDLTSWLHQQFQDISTREEAEKFGRKIMEMGLFKHVRGAHTFRDGNFFYTFTDEYRIVKASPKGMPKPEKPSPPTVPSREKKRDSSGQSNASTRSDAREPTKATQSPRTKKESAPKRHRVNLTAVLRCDLDPRNKSNRDETAKLHYDRLFNPETCYHFRLEWMSTTAKLVEEAISAWSLSAERYGLKLVEAPIAESCKVAEVNPFRAPSITTLVVPPPEVEPDLSHVDSSAPEPLPTHRYHPYQRALLKKFGFVLDQEAGVNFPADVDVRYTYAHEPYTYSQYIHKSGVIMAQVDTEGRLLLVANRLANNRAGFFREVTTRRDDDRFPDSRPGTGMLTRSALLQSPIVNHAPSSPGKSPGSDFSTRDRLSSSQTVSVTAEQLKEEIEAFCNDEAALVAFYEDVGRRDPTLSPGTTPAFGPRHVYSSRSTPLMQATIPTLELPPISGIGMMLQGAGPGTGGEEEA